MNGKKAIKAVFVPLAAVLISSAINEAVDNPHVEPRQHEEEPRLTYDSAYSTTSGVMLSFPLFGFDLESIHVPALRKIKGR